MPMIVFIEELYLLILRMTQSAVGLFVNIFLQIILPFYYLTFLISVVSVIVSVIVLIPFLFVFSGDAAYDTILYNS